MTKLLLTALTLLVATPAAAQTIKLRAARIVTIAPVQDAKPTPTPTPVRSPTPPHQPMPMPADFVSVPSPSLAGLDPIASGVDVAKNLEKSWGSGAIPGTPPSVEDEGAFRFNCAPGQLLYDDPVVYPGQAGKSHLHQFFGNTLADANSTYRSLRTTGESTCNNLLNRSAYWISAMIHPSGKVVIPDFISVYYKRPQPGSSSCRLPSAKACLPLPRGLRYVFGYNMQNPKKSDPTTVRWWNCDGNGAVNGHFATIKEAARGCPVGARLGGAAISPNCWNGKDLDSPDHRSHMAFQSYGDWGYPRCPATHPYLVPYFEAIPWYMNDGTAAEWKLSSDVAMGTEGGVTLHADWFGAWEDSIKDIWTANCIDKGLSCSGGDLGNGTMVAQTAKSPLWSKPGKPTLLDAPVKPIAMAH